MGEVFAGRYELVDPIGRGGVGAVWRAWDHRRRRYVAAKVLQQRDAHSLLRFVREQALRIDHPHVLAPASWAADDDKVLFTMDLVAGGSLVHLIGDYGPLPPSFVCTLLDQLLSGLSAVHAEGVVHRDIKPANVLLEATGTGRPRLRLSDFGIAMRLGEPRLTETNLVVGTPGYIAPEQMLGAEPDFPADLFAVGLVALYLLEGAKPDAKALVQHFASHGTPSAPKGIPEPLWQVVASMLQPDPQARFRTATGARKALASAVELLPDPGPDDEQIEIFDQLGPLPPGFGPGGPHRPASGVERGTGGSKVGTAGPGSSGAGITGLGAFEEGAASRAQGGDSGGAGGGVQGRGAGGSSVAGSVSAEGSEADGSGPGNRRGHWVPSGQGAALPEVEPGANPHAAPPGTGPQTSGSSPISSGGNFVPSEPHQGTPSPPLAPTPIQPTTMSDTGSFHLPPPRSTASSPQTPSTPTPHRHRLQAQPQPQPQPHPHPQAQPPHRPPHHSPHDPTHVLSSPRQPAPPHQPAEPPTASYTAEVPQVPHSAQAIPRHRRPSGPPAKVAIPVLLLALACYAVGIWALTRL